MPESEKAGHLAPLIGQLLRKDPDRRPTAAQALKRLRARPTAAQIGNCLHEGKNAQWVEVPCWSACERYGRGGLLEIEDAASGRVLCTKST
ncbi:hypothetical protein [Actinomadura rubteroloni]|uniref:hypothetical protein n=1 Tax=Actinomadura rubteroloni TaxID=1926885 RepID=UPI000CD7FAD7|nr:hypothetical protein [Actinomadura rubteroloni]